MASANDKSDEELRKHAAHSDLEWQWRARLAQAKPALTYRAF